MNRTAWTVMTMIVALDSAAGARAHASQAPPDVTACMHAQNDPKFIAARLQTSAMFARIGVKLEWRTPDRCPAGGLSIALSQDSAADSHPGALGYATPYDGTHIVILWDRIQATVEEDRVSALLAHVLAHEITHVLEGISRHSGSGVMKAHWTESEFVAMRQGLPFAPEDVELIHAGLAKRQVDASARP